MDTLKFDQINKFVEFRIWLEGLKPSDVMEQKYEIRDGLWSLLEYCYMLGFLTAREELGLIASDVAPFLPPDYLPTEEVGETTPSGTDKGFPDQSGGTEEGFPTPIPADFIEKKWESIYKTFDGMDASDRTLVYAEMGDAQSILKVAETDGHRVYMDGGYVGAKGHAYFKTWETVGDDKVRDTHNYLDGMKVPIDERFYTYDGDSALYPGDFNDVANNANCRCTISYTKE